MSDGKSTNNMTHIIESPPGRPADARLQASGVPVWALIAYLRDVDGDVGQVARDYEIPAEEVEAAVAFYTVYRDVIDARIVLNAAPAT